MTRVNLPSVAVGGDGRLSATRVSGRALVGVVQSVIDALESTSAGTTAPPNPEAGALWWDSGAGSLKVFTGSAWHSLSSSSAATDAPLPVDDIERRDLSASSPSLAITSTVYASLDKKILSLRDDDAAPTTTPVASFASMSQADWDALRGSFTLRNDTASVLVVDFGARASGRLFCPRCYDEGGTSRLAVAPGAGFKISARGFTEGANRRVELYVIRDGFNPSGAPGSGDGAPLFEFFYAGAAAATDEAVESNLASYTSDSPHRFTDANIALDDEGARVTVDGAPRDVLAQSTATAGARLLFFSPRRIIDIFERPLGNNVLGSFTERSGVWIEYDGDAAEHYAYYTAPLNASSARPAYTLRFARDEL